MPHVCEICKEEFYSDTEFHEHVMFHKYEALVEKAQAGNSKTAAEITHLRMVLMVAICMNTMDKHELSFSESVELLLRHWDKLAEESNAYMKTKYPQPDIGKDE